MNKMKQDNLDLNESSCVQKLLYINDTLDILGGKWKLSIVACLTYSPMRYSEMLSNIPGISGKMLSKELKELEINEIIERHVLSTSPVSVEYTITEYGKTIQEVTDVISDWGMKHRQRIINGMKKGEVTKS